MKRRTADRLLRAATAAGVVLVMACSGESAGPGGPTGPSPIIVYTPDRPAGAGSIALRAGPGTTATVLDLEVVATGITNAQAVDFALLYPPALLRLDGAVQGEFLGPGTTLVVQGMGGGATLFLLTRGDPGGVSGDGVVMRASFAALAAGVGRIDFSDQEIQDPFGLEIPGVEWIGGTVQVVR